MNKKILWHALGHAVLAVVYIGSVTFFMSTAEKIVPEKSVLGPIVFLMLLVLSASVMGILFFGRPILMYLDNKKKEAVQMLFSTIGWFLMFFIIGVVSLIIF